MNAVLASIFGGSGKLGLNSCEAPRKIMSGSRMVSNSNSWLSFISMWDAIICFHLSPVSLIGTSFLE